MILNRMRSWLGAPPPALSAKAATIRSYAEFCAGRDMPAHPLEVFIEISNVCDLKCVMCAEFSALSPERLTKLKAKQRGFLSEQQIVDHLDPVLRHCLAVHCSGFGEPTIHPDFRKIIERVSSYDVLIDFITNGMQLDGDLGDFIVERGVHQIMVSMSGATPEIYQQLYVGGDFNRVLAGIRHVAEAKKARGTRYPLIEINSLAFRDHVASFDRFVELVAANGADVVHLKTLQPYLSVPQLYEHASIMRPWVEGPIIERAIATGRRLGVHVDAGQYLADGVSTSEEYEARMAAARSTAESKLGKGKFGGTPIEAFADLAKTIQPNRGEASPRRPVGRALPAEDDMDAVCKKLRIEPLPPSERFHCMEPFKTLYVNRNGGVKTCCFARDAGWLMGDVGRGNAAGIWTDHGYQATRNAILDGAYPMANCDFCLENRVGPSQSNASALLHNYVEWHTNRFGPGLKRELAAVAPDALARITSARTEDVVARLRRRGQARPTPIAVSQLPLTKAIALHQADGHLIEGNLERVDEEVVGWVWSPAQPGLPLNVQIWRQGEKVVEQVADLYRGDLHHAGKGDGHHAFSIMLADAPEGLDVTTELNGILYRFPSSN
jgi:uncharacterized Fe-S cluster-containing radical SAM superfamily protein